MSKYTKGQTVISRHSDSYIDEDNWIDKIQKSLSKNAVQPKIIDKSIFEQISSIMNNKSKYPSVQAAVDDMKNRSGLTAYLNNINKTSNKKIASDNNNLMNKKISLKPIVIKNCPSIMETIRNYITDTKGNLSIPAIIEKIKTIHQNDVSNEEDWNDDNLIRQISKMNLEEKSKATNVDEHYNDLGKNSNFDETEIDPSNTDAFNILNPAKF